MSSGRRNNASAKLLKETRSTIRAMAGGFTDDKCELLAYRYAVTARPDGYSTSSRAGEDDRNEVVPTRLHDKDCPHWQGGDCVCGATSEKTSTTEATALRRLEGGSQKDPQRAAVERIVLAFERCVKELRAAEHALEVIEHAKDGVTEWRDDEGNIRRRDGRVAYDEKSVCMACLRQDVPNTKADRLRSGYCGNCYRAWVRTDKGQGRQDRNAFEASRKNTWVVEGVNTADLTGYAVDEIDELIANGTLPAGASA